MLQSSAAPRLGIQGLEKKMSATEMKMIAELRRRNAALSLAAAREYVRGLSAAALALYAASWGVL
jgi:hypothetical protein